MIKSITGQRGQVLNKGQRTEERNRTKTKKSHEWKNTIVEMKGYHINCRNREKKYNCKDTM